MSAEYDKTRQFKFTPWEFLAKLDLINWMRYAAIVKELTKIKPTSVLEVGPGEGVIKNVMKDFVERYDTLDVNPKLSPTYESNIRKFIAEASGKYDCVIAADILEHIPFEDLEIALKNLNAYLKPGSTALITIPHRSHYLFFMTSWKHKPHIVRIPTLKWFLRPFGQKVAIDPDHQWETGDGKHKIKDVENAMRKAGFKIERRQKLVYVDFWILKKYG
ncbi:MAG: methyltransferase type 11 [Candidatus Jorgensenbacteria bacterium GW2011_GWC1_48_8]|uniref:Methyltransferase type 11 n=1 Tax=Candidatus Jorgensenbacteria bacterium GW2011_GWC1_48_8 TaxID=1618666 RepID=A0A0G1XW66_9BACT|nr:MAG: hypothetical protein UW89_C0003G0013 [Parcubacteria group bacterium GW2011_GWB1_45_10]KKU98555.1 MAG: methyltransferase type 11 [Candidatus Jorgensenbacteria bacterium GW2011_GWC1_48_8]